MFATTKPFLDDLGLDSLDQLPAMEGVTGQAAILEQIELGITEPGVSALQGLTGPPEAEMFVTARSDSVLSEERATS